MKTKVHVLTICGSGVVTSSMIANKITEMLGDEGYDVSATEANPTEIENYLMRTKYDFIAYSTPVGNTHGVPAINAMGVVTGMGDEEFLQEALKVLKASGK